MCRVLLCFFFQAEDGIRDLVRSRGLGDVYKRQAYMIEDGKLTTPVRGATVFGNGPKTLMQIDMVGNCLLYTSDAADERSSVDLGGRRIIKKKNK